MDKIQLMLPTEKYLKQCEICRQSVPDMDVFMYLGKDGLPDISAAEWLQQCRDFSRGKNLPEGYVPFTRYIAVRLSDDKVVGILTIRHELNDYLLKLGGHIGFGVAADERKKGYAKEMLRQALFVCKDFGIDKALVTCGKANIASRKTILANGGRLENEVDTPDFGVMQRYWVPVPERTASKSEHTRT
ncbi:MAG: GNAT family N-acetyltransferase [Firmicutes bacterium]|nr:GNAT family N-acetyltransferase [Bacillota bacterium]